MNVTIDRIPALVMEELESANLQHAGFSSPHEGYAVLLEESEEARDEMLQIASRMHELWRAVKSDSADDGRNIARIIEERAVRLAAEAIQVAAMARKFRAVEPGEGRG